VVLTRARLSCLGIIGQQFEEEFCVLVIGTATLGPESAILILVSSIEKFDSITYIPP
jgi:hypothetical protein